MLIPHGFFPSIEGIYLTLKTRTGSFHPFLHLPTFSLFCFFYTIAIHLFIQYIHSFNKYARHYAWDHGNEGAMDTG